VADPVGPGLLGALDHLVAAGAAVLAAVVPVGQQPAVQHAFPVAGKVSYVAAHHDYPATDVFGRCGSAVRAPSDGWLLEVRREDVWDPASNRGADRGGRSFTLLGDDGVRYYGSHLRALTLGLEPGDRVSAGDRLGDLGESGDARGVGCHLHFGISPLCHGTGEWWLRRGAVAPYPFLRSWQGGGDASPVRTVRAWQRGHGCPGQATVDR
jgi:murein DD-endopeptidase MepM/ murein hydrolase activator NlpD